MPDRGRVLSSVSVLLLVLLTTPAARLAQASGRDVSPPERTVRFTYTVEIGDVPAGARTLDLWIPTPRTDAFQEVMRYRIESTHRWSLTRDPEYGNTMLHLAVADPARRPIALTMEFLVRRLEHVRRDLRAFRERPSLPPAPSPRWLMPDLLVPLDARVRAVAARVTRGRTSDFDKARAIYDYAAATMTHDESSTGRGRGDIHWTFANPRGDCVDVHALFTGLCRAIGIFAKFAIGFPLPSDRDRGAIDGYHCWSEFYVRGFGWVPVDTSGANRFPEKRDYFFGAHDAHRVQFSVGRDVVLEPPQAGPPLNYFIYPYAEVDGRPFQRVSRAFRFENVDGASVDGR